MSQTNPAVDGGPISRTFWAKKLHSLTGVMPIGVFLLEHFWTNSFAIYGPQEFDEAVKKLQSLPYVIFLEVGMIVIPILYHAIYGFVISWQGRPNQFQYPFMRNWMYTLQRVTGMILFFYIGWHVYETRVTMAIRGETITFDYMAQILNHPLVIVFYMAGILSAVFHFANGLWSFMIGWGITTTVKSMRYSGYFCTGFGIFLGLIGINSFLGFFGKAFMIHL